MIEFNIEQSVKASYEEMSTSQLKEILHGYPPGTDLPLEALSFLFYEHDEASTYRLEELLPELIRLDYRFDSTYREAVQNGDFFWVHFFLTHIIPGLNLNQSVYHYHKLTVHPLTQMKLLATQLSLWCSSPISRSFKLGKEEMQQHLDGVHEIIREMESHPEIDVAASQEEIKDLRKFFYFEGDPDWERDCIRFAEAATIEGLIKLIAEGFNLYEPIGPFFILMEIDADTPWLEVLSYVYGYDEYELIDLMESHANKD